MSIVTKINIAFRKYDNKYILEAKEIVGFKLQKDETITQLQARVDSHIREYDYLPLENVIIGVYNNEFQAKKFKRKIENQETKLIHIVI